MHNCNNWKTVDHTNLHTILPEMFPISSDGSIKELHFTNQDGTPFRIVAQWESLKIQTPTKKKKHNLIGTLCPGVEIDETFDDPGKAEQRRDELTAGLVTKPELSIKEIETYE